MKKSRRGISFEKDIFKEVSEELGIDFKLVEDVYYTNNKYMAYLTKKTLCSNIILPHLGNIYLKYSYLTSYLSNTSSDFLGIKKSEERVTLFKEKKGLMLDFYHSEHPSRRAFIKNFMGSLISKMKRQLRKPDKKLGTIEEISEIQKLYYEKTKQG